MVARISGQCSLNNCANLATYQEIGESDRWLFYVQYCDEHRRQAELGTPLGPLGIDPTRIVVRAKGIEEPVTGGITPSLSPH